VQGFDSAMVFSFDEEEEKKRGGRRKRKTDLKDDENY
jgi:hypothetical protein